MLENKTYIDFREYFVIPVVLVGFLGRGTKKTSEPSREIEPQTSGFRVPMLYYLATETLYGYRLLYYIKVHISETRPAYCYYQGNKGQQIA